MSYQVEITKDGGCWHKGECGCRWYRNGRKGKWSLRGACQLHGDEWWSKPPWRRDERPEPPRVRRRGLPKWWAWTRWLDIAARQTELLFPPLVPVEKVGG